MFELLDESEKADGDASRAIENGVEAAEYESEGEDVLSSPSVFLCSFRLCFLCIPSSSDKFSALDVA